LKIMGGIYTEKNIEDWDFRTRCDPESPEYDVEADAFLDAHYVTVVAVDMIRLGLIEGWVRSGIAELDEDGEHINITKLRPDPALSGARAALPRSPVPR
jgi:hypothetical protein